MRIIFMGSPDFAVPALNKLLESKDHEVVAVYTQPPKPAARGMSLLRSKIHQRAEELGIPVYAPKSLRNEEEHKIFSELKPDCAVVAAYGLILPKPILTTPKWGCINIHPSRLPRWRGAAPIQRAIMAGDKETSVCIMQMEEGLDSGGIYKEKIFEIPRDANAGYMHDLLAEEGAKLLLEALDNIENYSKNIKPQSEAGLTYASKITSTEEKIDFTKPAKEIYDLIRGLSPYPAAHLIHDGLKYKIFKADYVLENHGLEIGKIIHDKNIIKIACKDGFILPLEIQKEGKKRMPIQEFLKGNSID